VFVILLYVAFALRGIFSVLAVKAPGYGDRKKEELQDIAVTIGATVISDDLGLSLEKVELSHLGRADRVVATKDKTILVGGKGKKTELEKRIKELRAQVGSTKYKFDKEAIEKRLAKLVGGVAVIRVGAATETEMKYLKLKIEDAVNATKAAIAEGIVPGGGVALVKAATLVREKAIKSKLLQKMTETKRESEFAIGYMALVTSLDAPLSQIAKNAGHEDAAVIVEKVRTSTSQSFGYDANEDTIEGVPLMVDMLKRGIVDPVKVTRTALENAASAAAILLTTDVAIAEEPVDGKEEHHNKEVGY
jgi:chaperonin GroEL